MADTSASHLIWFIAAVITATALSGVIVKVSFDISEKVENQGRALSGQLSYDISIENDVTMVPYNNTTHELKIYVKNIGERTIHSSEINITFILFMTGGNLTDTHFLPVSHTILDGSDELLPGRTIMIIYDVDFMHPSYQYHIKLTATEYSEVYDQEYIRIAYV